MLWFLLAALIGVAGPFGTYAVFPLAVRMVFWGAVLGGAVLVWSLLERLFRRRLCHMREGYGVLFFAALMATFYTPGIDLVSWILRYWGRPPDLTMRVIWIAIFLSSVVFMTARGLRGHPRQECTPAAGEADGQVQDQATGGALSPDDAGRAGREDLAEGTAVAGQEADDSPRLMARLEVPQRAPFVSLSVRDHYVEVTTETATASLLMRFADAMAELDGVDGMQVHRSHWVAARAVAGYRRERGRNFILLKDGRRIPVSRSYHEAVASRWPLR